MIIPIIGRLPTDNNLMASAFRPLGYQIQTAYSGEEELAVFDSFPDSIDMLITDFIMPGMNGKEFWIGVSHNSRWDSD